MAGGGGLGQGNLPSKRLLATAMYQQLPWQTGKLHKLVSICGKHPSHSLPFTGSQIAMHSLEAICPWHMGTGKEISPQKGGSPYLDTCPYKTHDEDKVIQETALLLNNFIIS